MRLTVVCEVHTEAEDSVFIPDTECVLCELRGEAGETVELRASNMIKCKHCVSTCKKYQLCVSALSWMIDCKYVAKIWRNFTVCVKMFL